MKKITVLSLILILCSSSWANKLSGLKPLPLIGQRLIPFKVGDFYSFSTQYFRQVEDGSIKAFSNNIGFYTEISQRALLPKRYFGFPEIHSKISAGFRIKDDGAVVLDHFEYNVISYTTNKDGNNPSQILGQIGIGKRRNIYATVHFPDGSRIRTSKVRVFYGPSQAKETRDEGYPFSNLINGELVMVNFLDVTTQAGQLGLLHLVWRRSDGVIVEKINLPVMYDNVNRRVYVVNDIYSRQYLRGTSRPFGVDSRYLDLAYEKIPRAYTAD